jgi:hypothetical protein
MAKQVARIEEPIVRISGINKAEPEMIERLATVERQLTDVLRRLAQIEEQAKARIDLD